MRRRGKGGCWAPSLRRCSRRNQSPQRRKNNARGRGTREDADSSRPRTRLFSEGHGAAARGADGVEKRKVCAAVGQLRGCPYTSAATSHAGREAQYSAAHDRFGFKDRLSEKFESASAFAAKLVTLGRAAGEDQGAFSRLVKSTTP